MKNRVIRLTTKAAAVVTMAGIIVGTSSTIAKADDGTNENTYEQPVYAELVPEAQCIDDFNKTEYICEDGYEPVIQTELVPEAHVRIDDPEPVPEITYNDGTTVRAELVSEAQCIDDLNETEYKWVDGQGPTIIRTELVPEEAPVIVNEPCLYKELVPTAPVIIGSAPNETENQVTTPEEETPSTPTNATEQIVEKPTTPKRITVIYYPDEEFIKELNLQDCVRNRERGLFDCFYDTYRGNGEWKHVGSEDMVKYVRDTLGESDPRYRKLEEYCKYGSEKQLRFKRKIR